MALLSLQRLIVLGLYIAGILSVSQAQDAPLFLQGGLEGALANDDTYNTGGSISINGFDIQVPKNLLVQFPAAWVPWKDFVADKESMIGYEINVSLYLRLQGLLFNRKIIRRLLETSSMAPQSQARSWPTSFSRG